MDRIFVEGLHFVGKHGVFERERLEGRRFAVDVQVELDAAQAADSDALEDTMDYGSLCALILEVGKGPSHQLIESLAGEMILRIFERFGIVSAVELTLRKFAEDVPGSPGAVGITLRRER